VFVYVSGNTYCLRGSGLLTYLSAPAETGNIVQSTSCGGKEKWELEILSPVSYVEIEYDLD